MKYNDKKGFGQHARLTCPHTKIFGEGTCQTKKSETFPHILRIT